jgi:zinc and cadmium transporter
MESNYIDVIIWSLVGSLASMVGGFIIVSNQKLADKLSFYAAPFAAGALLGAAFLDLFPEAVEIDGSHIFKFALLGIVSFFLLEHYLHYFHHHKAHKHEPHSPPSSLIIIGDTIHNAIDGVVIGAAFVVSPSVGIVTTLAVAAHEIPQEIGDFGILLKSGMNRKRVIFWNVISALATLIAAVYTFNLGANHNLPLGPILGLAAGLFIYIAASDLIPSIHAEAKGRFSRLSILLLLLGIALVALFAH